MFSWEYSQCLLTIENQPNVPIMYETSEERFKINTDRLRSWLSIMSYCTEMDTESLGKAMEKWNYITAMRIINSGI